MQHERRVLARVLGLAEQLDVGAVAGHRVQQQPRAPPRLTPSARAAPRSCAPPSAAPCRAQLAAARRPLRCLRRVLGNCFGSPRPSKPSRRAEIFAEEERRTARVGGRRRRRRASAAQREFTDPGRCAAPPLHEIWPPTDARVSVSRRLCILQRVGRADARRAFLAEWGGEFVGRTLQADGGTRRRRSPRRCRLRSDDYVFFNVSAL